MTTVATNLRGALRPVSVSYSSGESRSGGEDKKRYRSPLTPTCLR